MRHNHYFILLFVLLAISACHNNSNNYQELREQHEHFLNNSPFKSTKDLSRADRKKAGLPPNAYNEQLWELTMDPQLGIPTPFLVDDDIALKGAPGTNTNPWIERGPLNTGGRTRVVFFDPNDSGANNGDGIDYNRVFAGGIGGGLWVNNNINSPSSPWTIVPGIASNLSVNSFAIDPNNTNIIYIGTGEQYTFGAAVGNGVYKTTDGGTTWNNVNITPAGPGSLTGTGNIFDAGIFFVNDMIIRNNNGTSEIYAGIGASLYASPNGNIGNPNNVLGAQSAGLYRSVDDGATWSRVENPSMAYNFSGGTFYVIPNDLEIGADNTLFMGTIAATSLGQGGGRIYSSTDGLNWSLDQTLPQTDRVEIATSSSNANLIYAATDGPAGADLYISNNKLASISAMNEPNDADTGISATDFARGQAFYDLVIEVDPTNDQNVYVAGIDLFRSTNGGASWTQISKWANNANLNTLNVPFIHADIHVLSFQPGNANRAVIGSDGGVSYANSLSNASFSTSAISTRNLGYNVTQFYYGDISDNDVPDGDDLAGGTQDNGSLITNDASATNLNAFFDPIGGDGGYTAIDKDGGYAVLSVTGETHLYVNWPIPNGSNINSLFSSGNLYLISQGSGGDFINPAELDENRDILFTNSRSFTGANTINQCQLFSNSATCNDITNALISGARPTAMKVSPHTTTSSRLFVGTVNSRLIRVDNANTASPTWTNISGPQFLGSVSDIEFGSTEQEIYVTMHNYGVQNIWYTNDGGSTWSGKEGNLPNIPVKCILQNPLISNEVIVGTEQGIYISGDFNSASPTWTQANNQMTSVRVIDLDLRTSDNTILATTHGRGMFTGNFDTLSNTRIDTNTTSLFPTLTSDHLNVVSSTPVLQASVSIYNMAGQQIYQEKKNLNNTPTPIHFGKQTPGVYIMNIQNNELKETHKFIVQ